MRKCTVHKVRLCYFKKFAIFRTQISGEKKRKPFTVNLNHSFEPDMFGNSEELSYKSEMVELLSEHYWKYYNEKKIYKSIYIKEFNIFLISSLFHTEERRNFHFRNISSINSLICFAPT